MSRLLLHASLKEKPLLFPDSTQGPLVVEAEDSGQFLFFSISFLFFPATTPWILRHSPGAVLPQHLSQGPTNQAFLPSL